MKFIPSSSSVFQNQKYNTNDQQNLHAYNHNTSFSLLWGKTE
jgi:hypothetical protein